jgi:CheY-like chemotaxis protein
MPRHPIVLFVDDDPTTRRIYEYKFMTSGITGYVVDSAEGAVRVLEQKKVDVVVTDLMMPRYDGNELIECLRESPVTKHLPIIVFTTGGNQEMMLDAMKVGATEVLPKYTTPPDRLVERLHFHTRDAIAREELVRQTA